MKLKFLFSPLPALIPAAIFLAGCGKTETDPVETTPATPEAPALSVEASGIPLPQSGQRPLTAGEQKMVVDQLMKARAQQQAQGLGNGVVKVNGAWNYEGFSYLSPDPNAAIEARLVAVDVSISGHTEHFDIDDIEIVDGASLMSYGSDPHATPLTPEGKILPLNQLPPVAPRASRWLLIYAFPKQSPAFHLYYWGKKLTPNPVELQPRGMELPYPAEESQ